MALRACRRTGRRVGLTATALGLTLLLESPAAAAPAPPPMVEPEPLAPAPTPPPMVDPNAPPAPTTTAPTAPVAAPVMRPANGSGAIIGGSLLAGLGGAVVFASGIACAIVCGSDGDTRPILLGVMAGGAAAVGGGAALEVVGFQRFRSALEWERRYQIQATSAPRHIALATMLGGFFTSSFFGLISGGITKNIYKRRWNEAHHPNGQFPMRLSWSPLVSPGMRGLVLGGRF